MQYKPLVSVSLPTYNHQSFIAASIESVLSQDYENIEIVIGDDCSQDGTWRIVSEYQFKHPKKIKAFRNRRNLGITGNCNEIINRCTGEYVVFCSGDDLFLPGKISAQVERMESNQRVILCYHNVEVFDSLTEKTIRYWNRGSGNSKAIYGGAEKVAMAVVRTGNNFIAAMSVMVRKKAIPVYGYDQRIPFGSDWLMLIDILGGDQSNGLVEYLPTILARYRRHDSNVTNSGYAELDDLYVTLAIAESRYQNLIKSTDECRLLLRYSKGVRLLLSGDYSNGRNMLLKASFFCLRDWRYLYWIAASFVPFLLKLKQAR